VKPAHDRMMRPAGCAMRKLTRTMADDDDRRNRWRSTQLIDGHREWPNSISTDGCSFGEPFAHSRNSDLSAVRISNDDAYIVGV